MFSGFTSASEKEPSARLTQEKGVNEPMHLAVSQAPVTTFGSAAVAWKEGHLAVNKKRSSQRSTSCELNKHILPRLKDTPIAGDHLPASAGCDPEVAGRGPFS
jgi:hypothetical protein